MSAHRHHHIRNRNVGGADAGAGAAGGAAPKRVFGDDAAHELPGVTRVVESRFECRDEFLGIQRRSGFHCGADAAAAAAFRAAVHTGTVNGAELFEFGNTEGFLFFNRFNFGDGTGGRRLFAGNGKRGLKKMRVVREGKRRNKSEGRQAVNDPDKNVEGFQRFGVKPRKKLRQEVADRGESSPRRSGCRETQGFGEEPRKNDGG